MLATLALEEYSARLAAGTATPGGGSAAALAGALAAALVEMVCALTIGRDAYRAHEPALMSMRDQAREERRRLLDLVDRDARAYDGVMEALRLPKATDEEKGARRAALSKATLHATETPLAAAEACVSVLGMTVDLATKGNRNARSDVGTAAALAHAGLEGSILNVRINLGGIGDADKVALITARAHALESDGIKLKKACLAALAAGATT